MIDGREVALMGCSAGWDPRRSGARRQHDLELSPGLDRWVFSLMAAGVLIVISFMIGGSDRIVRARYSFRSGMSRTDVHGLMRGTRTITNTGISNAESMHIDGRYMIAVEYEPNPSLPTSMTNPADPAGSPRPDWVAEERVFVELARGDRDDNLPVDLRMRTVRSVDRDRMPRWSGGIRATLTLHE